MSRSSHRLAAALFALLATTGAPGAASAQPVADIGQVVVALAQMRELADIMANIPGMQEVINVRPNAPAALHRRAEVTLTGPGLPGALPFTIDAYGVRAGLVQVDVTQGRAAPGGLDWRAALLSSGLQVPGRPVMCDTLGTFSMSEDLSRFTAPDGRTLHLLVRFSGGSGGNSTKLSVI